MRIVVFSLLLFLLAFAITASVVHVYLREPEALYAAGRSEKLHLLAEWKDRANAGVFGTSRIHEGFDPEIFDSQFSSTATPMKSVNLGLYGGSQTEQRIIARHYLEQMQPHPDTLCLVILEWNAGLNFPPENRFHPRAVNLYGLDTMRFVYGYSDHSIPFGRRKGRLGFASLAALAHFTNTGMLSSLLFPEMPQEKDALEEARRGLRSPEANKHDKEEVERVFAERSKKLEYEDASILPGNRRLLDDLAQIKSAAPVHFIYLVTPTLENMNRAPKFPASMEGPNGDVPIINLADAGKFPQIFQSKYWRNTGHMNAEGAQIFSQLMGGQIEGWIAAHPKLQKCER